MFVKPRAKPVAIPPRKKRKLTSSIEEIAFDPNAREDYLTGFHKRKLQRIKQAKEEAAKKNKEEKLAARKILRENRRADLEKHVEAVNSLLREQNGHISESSEEASLDGAQQWEGITEELAVDHEEEYVDDDRFTTVTVEAVDVSKNGLQKVKQDSEDDSDATETNTGEGRSDDVSARGGRPASGKPKRVWTKEPPNGAKKKKKEFHYESKAERKVTRYKERSGNKAQAKARKD